VTLARYLLGVVLTVVALVPVCGGSCALRARVLPRWSGAPARLAEAVLGLSVVIGVSELLGAVGLFRVAPMVIGLSSAGAASWYLACRRSVQSIDRGEHKAVPDEPGAGSDEVEHRSNRLGRGALVVALVATAAVVAEWGTRVAAALHHGMGSIDTLWYHLPTAARFVQDGSITDLHYVDPGAVVVFYPANSPLLHGVGILLLGNDLLSPLINLGFLALALLAGWCFGRPFGVAPVTLTGTAVVLATPGFVATQPGGAYNDIVGLTLLLAAVALLVNVDWTSEAPRVAEIAVGALAAGLALGTKFTFIIPIAALSVGMIAIARRGDRVRQGSVWLFVVVLSGGFWYARNLLAVGNPLPGFSFGPLDLPSPPERTPTASVSDFLFDGSSWRKYFLPGLGKAYGPAWWALLALVGAGLVLAVLTGPRRLERMLGFVGIAAAFGYVFSPQILTLYGKPYYFVFNLRYAAPALLLGLVLLPTSPALAAGRRSWWVLGACALVVGAMQLDPSVWPTSIFGLRFIEPVRGGDALAGVIVGVAVLAIGTLVLIGRPNARLRPPGAAFAAAALASLLVVVGFGLQQVYLRGRYEGSGPPLAPWARNAQGERIAIAGPYTVLQYPLYGKDLSNHVQYVGKKGPHGAFDPIRECAAWRRSLNGGRYSYVVTAREPGGQSLESEWTKSDPAVSLVENNGWNRPTPTERQYPQLSLFKINGRLDPAGCKLLPENKRTTTRNPPLASAI
jgi:hypothetical protein